jgi:hypothetical protein
MKFGIGEISKNLSINRTTFKLGRKCRIPAMQKDLLWIYGAKFLLERKMFQRKVWYTNLCPYGFSLESGWLSRYSDWLWLDDRGSIPCRSKNFFFSIGSRPALGLTQPPSQ